MPTDPIPPPPGEWIHRRTGRTLTLDDTEAYELSRLQRMSSKEYAESPEWDEFKRWFYRVRDDPIVCRACGGSPVDLHHPDYSVVGQELPYGDDVIPLCREHHEWTELLVKSTDWKSRRAVRKRAHHAIIAAYREIEAKGLHVEFLRAENDVLAEKESLICPRHGWPMPCRSNTRRQTTPRPESRASA